jgi:hypothetical protein
MPDSITPPPELIGRWEEDWHHSKVKHIELEDHIANEAAQWGADQQLEDCCEQLKSIPSPLGIPFGEMASNALRSACRPKPPSLKARALKLLDGLALPDDAFETIRFALEALPND